MESKVQETKLGIKQLDARKGELEGGGIIIVLF